MGYPPCWCRTFPQCIKISQVFLVVRDVLVALLSSPATQASSRSQVMGAYTGGGMSLVDTYVLQWLAEFNINDCFTCQRDGTLSKSISDDM